MAEGPENNLNTVPERDVKEVIAANLTAFRKAANLTQTDLAERLNYTDKAVSKWERGESLPDIAVLKQITDMYGVTLDELVTPHSGHERVLPRRPRRYRVIIPILSAGLAWLAATALYVVLSLTTGFTGTWLAFIYAIPVTFIILLVFNALWGKKVLSGIIISLLTWSIPVAAVLTFSFEGNWLLFLIPIPFQVLVILWYVMRAKKR